MQTHSVLVVDDDKEIRDAVKIYLRNEGLSVVTAKDGVEAVQELNRHEFHLIVLDLMMPRADGMETIVRIRENRNIPIIILSAKGEEHDKILGLQVGADDYVTKPFNPLELIARVKSQLRRYVTLGTYQSRTSDEVIDLNGLSLDKRSKQVNVYGDSIQLTPIEYRIVELLMTNAGRVFSISEIYERVWKAPGFNVENTVAVHIRKIREKIEIDPRNPRYLKVVWGIGYKIER